MPKFIDNLENKTVYKYGFEHPHTIRIFRITNFLKKFFKTP